jgi:hypothetical protein
VQLKRHDGVQDAPGSMPAGIACLLAAAVKGNTGAQNMAVANGAILQLSQQIMHSGHGLCSGGDERLLQSCKAVEAIIHNCPAAKVRSISSAPVFMDAHWAATGSLVLDLGAAEGYICLQVSVSSTALLPALEVLIPRLTIGSWASSRGQLGLAAASLRAITAAITDDAANVEAFLNTNPLKPLVRALSLPANEEAPVCAMRCVQALCNASRVAQANLHEHKAVNVLTKLVQMTPGGFPAKQNDLKHVALRSLASLVDGFPDAQAEACQGAHSCFFVLLLGLHVTQSGL